MDPRDDACTLRLPSDREKRVHSRTPTSFAQVRFCYTIVKIHSKDDTFAGTTRESRCLLSVLSSLVDFKGGSAVSADDNMQTQKRISFALALSAWQHWAGYSRSNGVIICGQCKDTCVSRCVTASVFSGGVLPNNGAHYHTFFCFLTFLR